MRCRLKRSVRSGNFASHRLLSCSTVVLGLGSRAPHACAGFKLLENVFGNALTVFDCLRRSDEVRELVRPVVRTARRGRLAFEPKAQVTSPILRPMNEIVGFLEVRRPRNRRSLTANDSACESPPACAVNRFAVWMPLKSLPLHGVQL
jgi:hypothetical protein